MERCVTIQKSSGVARFAPCTSFARHIFIGGEIVVVCIGNKKELTNIEVKTCCLKAELSALIRMNGSISFSNRRLLLNIQTENAAIARRIYTLLKKGTT